MKNMMGMIAGGAMALSLASGSAFSANMGEKMMNMMQCSGACNTEYLQCVAAAQQLASTPMEGLSQLRTNFDNSTACGQAAIACNASCN